MIIPNTTSVEFAFSLLASLQQYVGGGSWYTWSSTRGDPFAFLNSYPLVAIALFVIVVGGLCVVGYRLFRIFYYHK